MRKNYLLSIFLFFSFPLFSQTYNHVIDSLIEQVNIFSLVKNVRELSGEDSTYVNGQKVLIKQRVSSMDNDLAKNYLAERLNEYGLNVSVQVQGTVKNVFAIQPGTLYPWKYYVICAHYDAVTYYAADDNASGCSAVLEAARLLSEIEFEYSIIYGFWDEEELGLIGSSIFADSISDANMNIEGVLNIDMIGWDSNNDDLIELHTKPIANSLDLTLYLLNINNVYNLELNPEVKNPGTNASDHSSFWDNGYGALLIIEGYFSGDFNPYYHSVEDRISQFNLPYFLKASKLVIGSLASMSSAVITGNNEYADLNNKSLLTIANNPNPFNQETVIDISVKNQTSAHIFIVNSIGMTVKEIFKGSLDSGNHKFSLNRGTLEDGFYLLMMQSGQEISYHKMIIAR